MNREREPRRLLVGAVGPASAALCVLLFAAGARADGDNGPNTGPTVAGNGGKCEGGPYRSPSGKPPSTKEPLCFTPGAEAGACRCADYGGGYPQGVFYSGGATGCDGLFGCESALPNAHPGCNKTTMAADPNCSYSAEASGLVGGFSSGSGENGGDGDANFDLCPHRQATVAGNRTELRDEANFEMAVQGAIHVEVQDCRLFGGVYQFNAPVGTTLDAGAGQPVQLPARPQYGDMVSVYGNWIGDIGHHGSVPEEEGAWGVQLLTGLPTVAVGRVSPHTEIHEAHAIAVTRPVSPTISYSFLNVNFVKEWDEDTIEFDVEVPKSENPAATYLTCVFDPSVLQLPYCPPLGNTNASTWAIPTVGRCHVYVVRDPAVPPLPYGCHQAEGCTGKDGKPLSWVQLDRPCGQIFFSGALRTEWVSPTPPSRGCGSSNGGGSCQAHGEGDRGGPEASALGMVIVALAARRRGRRVCAHVAL